MPFERRDKKEVERINRLQQERFDRLVYMFEPPLPKGVPERLAQIVASANILKGETILDVGTGTGILIPLIQSYLPGHIVACDLSNRMLKQLNENYSDVKTIRSDVRDLTLPDASVDVVFINACFPNIADKPGTFENLSRMMKPAGRIIISHPLGKQFVNVLKKGAPYPLDDFPDKHDAVGFFTSFGFHIQTFVDEPELYILKAVKKTDLP